MTLLVPDAGQLSQVMAQSTGPAFILGGGGLHLDLARSHDQCPRPHTQLINEIADDDTARAHLKSDIPRLRQRARLLNGATDLALTSGMCTALLLVVGFVTAYVGVRHEYGAGLLFAVAVRNL